MVIDNLPVQIDLIREYIGGSGAYYARVKLPDGSGVELKSRKTLNRGQWLELARDYWAKTQEVEEREPPTECVGWDACPYRRDRMVERGNAN